MSILNIWIPNLEKFNEDYKMSIINKSKLINQI